MSTLAQIRSRPVMKPAVKAKNASVNKMKSRSLMTFTDIFEFLLNRADQYRSGLIKA
ncbi:MULTISPECIES: hypothetical protein [Burkholderia]|nr:MULTISPECIES: hypothetical protein [Burkholderia]